MGNKINAVAEQSNVKKQLKSEDLFRILLLGKPEYKSLAGIKGHSILDPVSSPSHPKKCSCFVLDLSCVLHVGKPRI